MKPTGHEFLEATKYPHLSESDQAQDLPCPILETPEPGAPLINLPAPESLKFTEVSLQAAINNRRSLRKFASTPLSLVELTWLLWATQGISEKLPQSTRRTVPSAGARHPFSTYLAVTNTAGLEPGLYRYLAMSHQLAQIRIDSEIGPNLATICYNQKWLAKAAVTFIWVAVPYRTTWRYSERGWRYLFLDAGHVCQNLYLACEAIDAGACAVGAFYDDDLNQFLGIDGQERFAIFLGSAGHK